jgi:hypothetical protein
MPAVVSIENATIDRMASDKKFTDEFPCLGAVKSVTAARGGCGRCRKRRAQNNAYSKAKSCLAGMGSVKKLKLKEMLQAEKILITYAGAGGNVIKLSF